MGEQDFLPVSATAVLLAGAMTCAAIGALGIPNPLWVVLSSVFILGVAMGLVPSHSLGVLAPHIIVIVAGVAYQLPVPLTILFDGVLTDDRGFGTAHLIRAAELTNLGLLSFVAVSVLLRGSSLPPADAEVDDADAKERTTMPGAAPVGFALLLLGVLAAAVFILQAGGVGAIQSITYGERYLLMEGKGPLLTFVPLAALGGIILYAVGLGTWRGGLVGAAMAGLFLLWWTSVIGARSVVVQFVLGLLVVHQSFRRPIGLVPLFVFGGVFGLAAQLYGAFGRNMSVSLADAASLIPLLLVQLNPANGEFGGVVGTVGDILARVPELHPLRWGASYLEAFAVAVPQSIFPERPLAAGQWYAATMYPDVWADGGAFAFSPIAEAWLNFGFVGVIAIPAAGAILIHHLWSTILRPTSLARRPWVVVGYAISIPYLLLLPRLDSAVLLKSYLIVGLGGVFVSAVAAAILRTSLLTGSRIQANSRESHA